MVFFVQVGRITASATTRTLLSQCRSPTPQNLIDYLVLRLYLIISDDVTLNQSPKRAKNKDSYPMSEIDINKRLLTQVFHVDLDKDIME
jgi:hypothetical protein